MKNAFNFVLKVLFVLEIFTFLFRLFGYVKKRLDKETVVNFIVYASQTGQQIIIMHILPNMSK